MTRLRAVCRILIIFFLTSCLATTTAFAGQTTGTLATTACGIPHSDRDLAQRETLWLTPQEATALLEHASRVGNTSLLSRLSAALQGDFYTEPEPGHKTGDPIPARAKVEDSYMLSRHLGSRVDRGGIATTLVYSLPRTMSHLPPPQAGEGHYITLCGNEINLEDPSMPDVDPPDTPPEIPDNGPYPGDGDEDDDGSPPGPNGISSLDEWEASLLSPFLLLSEIPGPEVFQGALVNYPNVRAQLKWRNHSMYFWRTFFGNITIPSAHTGEQIDWLKVWYEQTHLKSYREATVFELGYTDDGFQNHGGANPEDGFYNGPDPVALSDLPEFFAIWNNNNPFSYTPPHLNEMILRSQWYQQFGYELDADWTWDPPPWLANGPDYLWVVIGGDMDPPDYIPSTELYSFLPPLPGTTDPLGCWEGCTAGTIIRQYADLRFEINQRLGWGQSAYDIVLAIAGPRGAAHLVRKVEELVQNTLATLAANGVTGESALQQVERIRTGIASELLSTGQQAEGVTVDDVYPEMVSMLTHFVVEQVIAERAQLVETGQLTESWQAQAVQIVHSALGDNELVMQHMRGIAELENFVDLDGQFVALEEAVSNYIAATEGVATFYDAITVLSSAVPPTVESMAENFTESTVPGVPAPYECYTNPPTATECQQYQPPTDQQLRAAYPMIDEMQALIDAPDYELLGIDLSLKDLLEVVLNGLTERLRQRWAVSGTPDADVAFQVFNTLLKIELKAYVDQLLVDAGLPVESVPAQYLIDTAFTAFYDGLIKGIETRSLAKFSDEVASVLATKFGATAPLIKEWVNAWGRLATRLNAATLYAEIAAQFFRIQGQFQEYAMNQLTEELQRGLVIYQCALGFPCTAAQYGWENETNGVSANMDWRILASWAAGSDYSGPVTILYGPAGVPEGIPTPPGLPQEPDPNPYGNVIYAAGNLYFAPLGESTEPPAADGGLPNARITQPQVTVQRHPIEGYVTSVTFTGRVRNFGPAGMSPSTVGFQWTSSADPNVYTLQAEVSLSSIGPNAARAFSVTIPVYEPSLPAADYSVRAVADIEDVVFESDEGNNTSPFLFAFTAGTPSS